MKEIFYMQRNGAAYCDIKLQSDNWQDAVTEVRQTANYALTKLPLKKRNKLGIDDYVEVYCGKLRKEMDFTDLRNPEVYQRVY